MYRGLDIKGNLTAEANVINVNEVISFDRAMPIQPTPLPATGSSQLAP